MKNVKYAPTLRELSNDEVEFVSGGTGPTTVPIGNSGLNATVGGSISGPITNPNGGSVSVTISIPTPSPTPPANPNPAGDAAALYDKNQAESGQSNPSTPVSTPNQSAQPSSSTDSGSSNLPAPASDAGDGGGYSDDSDGDASSYVS